MVLNESDWLEEGAEFVGLSEPSVILDAACCVEVDIVEEEVQEPVYHGKEADEYGKEDEVES